MSEIEKRAGRQSAEAAEQTRKEILQAAAELFCKEGYSKVSVRAISELAGVSHSLIRYHFGSKLNIWKQICDTMQKHFQHFVELLLEDSPANLPCNQRLFLVKVKIHASLLLNPRPMQLMADAIRQEGELLDYMFDDHEKIKLLLSQLLAECQQQGYAKNVKFEELKWVMLNSAHSASSMRPLLHVTYPDSTPDEALVKHHRFFSKILAGLLDVEQQQIPLVDSLEQVLGEKLNDYACHSCPWETGEYIG